MIAKSGKIDMLQLVTRLARVSLCFSCSLFVASMAFAEEAIALSASNITPDDVAVVVNEQDANSIEIGNYYLNARAIPEKNLIKVSIKPSTEHIKLKDFELLREHVYANLSPNIQVIVLMWTTPYAVGCNSITSAITMGYDSEQCKRGCAAGRINPYFNSASLNPAQDFDMRLSILLPTDDLSLAKSLIDKGVLSGFKLNESTAYFLKTKDKARSKPREAFFPRDLTKVESKKLLLRTISANSIRDKKDIMFYFTGVSQVNDLETLNFMPGAVADHLTSFGGVLNIKGQMSSLKWLQAGATGSFGTVSEPCNHSQKFPNPEVLINHYLAGETLIEAYWKSVYWLTQGLFIGEPLAAPYKN